MNSYSFTPFFYSREDILDSASYLFHLKKCFGDVSGGPVTKTLCFHCRGPGLDPWSGN